MSAEVGTLAWARRTGGILSIGDKVSILATAVAYQLRLLPAQVRWQLGLAGPPARVFDPDAMHAPDSRAAKVAEEHLGALAEPYLVNHSIRTYWFSRVLATHQGVRFDDELLYVASLLHDLGLLAPYLGGPGRPECFTLRGADAASKLVEGAGWDAERRDRLAEVITLHANVRVGLEHGLEAHLMNAGVLVDVTALRIWEINAQDVVALVERLPRLDMKRRLWGVWKAEADAHPACRGHFANRYLQFGHRVRSAPFSE